ncbi:GH1 family beta-glucosidase [Acidisarcina polymorpha]|nr:GH1 family beta-glucosidase [Acidisarcina polymorpha]
MNRRNFLTSALAVAGASVVGGTGLPASGLAAPQIGQSLHTADRPWADIPAVALPAGDIGAAQFPKDFWWGTATAAYQVEGAWNLDGKGESIWDRFSHTRGKVKGAATGDVACDQYHLYKEDIALMKRLNQKSYRFSAAWTRVLPTGAGAVNQKGLDYYSRLTDALLAAGIRPMCTLFHWDLPQPLEDLGGWPNRDTAAKFADYTGIVAKALGDRIDTWAIFNEPWVFTYLGYGSGVHAPGKTDPKLFLKASHTVNLGQGDAFRAMKAVAPKARIGSAYSMSPGEPATDSEADKAATARFHAINNVWFLNTALRGKYPEGFAGGIPEETMGIQPGDDKRMTAPLDWVGINYYRRTIVSDNGNPTAIPPYTERPGSEGPITEFAWEVWPKGLYDIVTTISNEYNKPIIEITENGCSYGDTPYGPDHDHVPDQRRVEFYRGHLAELARAMRDGANVRGYHAWSLLDNFEWAEGYSQRFGLTYVDYRNQKRTPKDSALWYSKVAATGRLDA